MKDEEPKELEQRDGTAKEIVGIQIGAGEPGRSSEGDEGKLEHGIWVCVDGRCVLRIRTPLVTLTDNRREAEKHDQNS